MQWIMSVLQVDLEGNPHFFKALTGAGAVVLLNYIRYVID